MVTEELIIDGQAVDMDSSTAVTLNFVSNLLGDIDAIETSRSQTISLPKTAHNRAVLDDPASPSHDSAARYVRHTAKYRRNGVEVISDGYAVLLRCADAYEVAVYWGILAKLQSWLDEGAALADLGWEPTSGVVVWEKGNTTSYSAMSDNAYVWADYDCGVGDRSDTEASSDDFALHPFVRASKILDLICDRAGITGRDIPSGVSSQISAEGVWLGDANLEGMHDPIYATALSFATTGLENYATFSFPTNDYFSVWTSQRSGLYRISYSEIRYNYEGRARVSYDITLEIGTLYQAPMLLLSDGSTTKGYQYMEQVSSGSTQWRAQGAMTFDVAEGDRIFLELDTDGEASVVSFTLGVSAPSGDDQLVLGDTYPCCSNMPDVTQLDFLKAMCAMHGMFVMADADGDLTLTTLAALTGSRSDAADWSDKLIASDTPCEPSETALSWGDYARHNWFRYKEDDTVGTDGDGDLQVANAALDEEKDIVTLPFCATDETSRHGETKAYIQHYSRQDDGELKTESVKPRIVQFAEGSDGGTLARFDGIKFPSLLTNWSELSALLNSCVAVTEEFRLTERDLLDLDFLKPIYLRQYGRYYGIVSIQTQDDGTCKAELLQLPLE